MRPYLILTERLFSLKRIVCRLPISSSSTLTIVPCAFGSGTKIEADELPIHITHNLHDVLIYLRHDRELRELWVDVICINQYDNVEKTDQIPPMGRVYFHAKCVIVWLGPPDEHPGNNLELMDLLATNANSETKLSRPTITRNEIEQFDEVRNAQRGLPSWTEERNKWNALAVFLSRPWFARIWILQEVILAPEAIVQVGDH
jgi:hypothetical protein